MSEVQLPDDPRIDRIRHALVEQGLERGSSVESGLRSCFAAEADTPGTFDAALELALGLAEDGVGPERVLSDGVHAVLKSRGESPEPVAEWLAPVGAYVRRLQAADVQLWTGISFGLVFVAQVAGPSLTDFRASLDRYGELLVELQRREVDSSRLVTHASRALGSVFEGQPWALEPLCVLAERVGATGGEPGWVWQICGYDWGGALIGADDAGPAAFERALDSLGAFLEKAPGAGMSAGSRLADGVVTFSRYGPSMMERLDEWLDLILALIRSMTSQGMSPYLPIGEGLGGIVGHVRPAELSDVLRFAVRLADRGIDPGAILYEALMPAAGTLGTPLAIEIGRRLAEQGFDPYFVFRHAAPSVGASSNSWGDEVRADRLEESLELLMQTALSLHAVEQTGQKYFMDAVPALAERVGGDPDALLDALRMGADLAARGLSPGMTMAFGWHEVLDLAEEHPWMLDEGRAAVEALGSAGVDPATTLMRAFPVLMRVTDGSQPDFAQLARTLLDVVTSLHAAGVSSRDVLYHDVSAMAEVSGDGGADAFRELLERLRALLSTMEEGGVSPKPFLAAGLPAAARVARAADGDTWRMDASFAAMQRWAALGHDGAGVLEHTVSAVAAADGGDRDRFEAMLDALERVSRPWPVETQGWVLQPLAECAAALWDGEADAFGAVLEAIVPRLDFSPGRDGVTMALVSGLPLLGEIAGASAADLATTFDAASAQAERMTEAERSPGDLLWYGLRSIAAVAKGQPAEGALLMKSLADWLTKEPAVVGAAVVRPPQSGGYDRHRTSAIEVLVLAVEGDAPALRRGLPRLFEVAHLFRVEDEVRRDSVRELLRVAATISKAPPPSFEQNLDWLCAQLAGDAFADSKGRLVSGLEGCLPLVRRFKSAWPSLLRPLVLTHGVRSIGILNALRWMGEQWIRKESDLSVLADIITQCGVRVPEILDGLILRGLREGAIADLTDERQSLLQFIRDVPVADSEIYRAFRGIQSDADASEAEKRTRVDALQDSLRSLSASVRSGEVTPEETRDPLFSLVLYYVFPPSTTTSRGQHAALFGRFGDHLDHMEARDPGELRRHEYALRQGTWELRPGVEIDRTPWELVMEVHASTPRAEAPEGEGAAGPEEALVALGWDLLGRWAEGRIGREAPKKELLSRVLSMARAAGVDLPAHAETPAQLIECKEFLGDHVRDVVERSLIAARGEDEGRYDRMVYDKIAPDTSIGAGLVKSMWKLAQGIGAGGLSSAEAAKRITGQLRHFEVDAMTMVDDLRSCGDRDEVRALLQGLKALEVKLEPGKEQSRLMSDFVGKELLAMHRELFGGDGRVSKLVYELSDSAEPLRITCELTKRRAHAPIGLCEGVCVAVDQRLWDSPHFFQVIFWGPDGIAAGGMHVLFVQEGEAEYLALPGINPTLRLLDTVEPSAALDLAVDYAWRLARHFGCEGVWVPASRAIHSNRRAIQIEIDRRGWAPRETSQHVFSYSPYAYTFREVFEVPPPATE